MTARRAAGAALAAALAVGVGAIVYHRTPPPEPPLVGMSDDTPLQTADSPFRNTRPGVAYVGDEKCASCHPDVAAAYRTHPMARSLAPVSAETEPPGEFDKLGYHFSAVRSGKEVIHRAERRDAAGHVIAAADLPIRYALGSGTRGKSYLAERDGRLTQSPMSWFHQSQGWDLSPGYASFFPGERGVEPVCLFCHANAVDPVPAARNRYREPVFRGHGIGCERCHGPGELHVASPGDRDPARGFDRTIVNPKHLGPALREAVCQQCHLQGERRFERRGRGPFDYRPGLPLEDYWAVYVRGSGPAGGAKAVGHVEQMQVSKCYTASGGALGCTSCHDPHAAPAEADKAAFYRGRCQVCHETGKPCSVPAADRTRQAPGDNCAGCHMPRYPSADIAHTAVTSHRVPRRQTPAEPKPSGEPPTLSNFFAGRKANDPDADRDLGLALVHADPAPGRRRTAFAEASLPLLEAAAARHPSDVPAVEGWGWALTCLNRPREALDAFGPALERSPDRELTLLLAAQVAEDVGQLDTALGRRQRLIDLNPNSAEYYTAAAKLHARRQDWSAAAHAAEASVRLNPLAKEPRLLLAAASVRLGRRDRAAVELETLVRLAPTEEKVLRAWFDKQR